MIRSLFFIFFLFSSSLLSAQEIKFDIQFNGVSLQLDKEYKFNGKPIRFSTCKFYVSNILFNMALSDVKSKEYYLVDLEDPRSLTIRISKNLDIYSVKKISIGVDSTKSVSGVYGGDLDPTNGMYWAWQSGYINCKIEGASPICPARKNKFQFHLGGYAFPYNSLQTVQIEKPFGEDNAIIVVLDLANFVSKVDLSKDYQVMSPNKKALKLSKLFSQSFRTND